MEKLEENRRRWNVDKMFFGEHYFYGPLGLETGAKEYTAKCLVMFKASESTQMVNGIGPFTEVKSCNYGLFQEAVWQNADGSDLVCDACTEIPGCKPAVQARVKD